MIIIITRIIILLRCAFFIDHNLFFSLLHVINYEFLIFQWWILFHIERCYFFSINFICTWFWRKINDVRRNLSSFLDRYLNILDFNLLFRGLKSKFRLFGRLFTCVFDWNDDLLWHFIILLIVVLILPCAYAQFLNDHRLFIFEWFSKLHFLSFWLIHFLFNRSIHIFFILLFYLTFSTNIINSFKKWIIFEHFS